MLLAQDVRRISEDRDRRGKPRICVPFYARVEGKDDTGEEFSIQTVLDNLSVNGLYLRIMPCVEEGARLAIELGLLTPPGVTEGATRFSIEGVVVRSERKTGGACGVAVNFESVRFV